MERIPVKSEQVIAGHEINGNIIDRGKNVAYGGNRRDHVMREDLNKSKDIWDRLRGGRVLVLGQESEAKDRFSGRLKEICEKKDKLLQISERPDDMCSDDYVIVSGVSDGWNGFFLLTGYLRQIGEVKPKAVLLLSDVSVYGKLYGEERPVKEDELGYVCHTDPDDQGAQRLRVAEHLCSRMAREDGIAVKIARLPGGWNDMEMILRVLLDGVSGEAYNIPGVCGEGSGAKSDRTSALMPNLIVTDTEKAGGLKRWKTRSESFPSLPRRSSISHTSMSVDSLFAQIKNGKHDLLRDRLNEFQLDWAQAAVRSEQITPEKIKNKKVLLVGETNSLAEAIAWSFEAWNDARRSGISVSQSLWEDGELRTVRSYAGESFDPEEADYIILTGYCCREIDLTADGTMDYLGQYLRMMQMLTKLPDVKLLLLSDGRVYGKLAYQFAASEYEAGKTDPCSPGYEAQYLLQALESILITNARESGTSYQILRTAKIFGAYMEMMDHSAWSLARLTASGQEDVRNLCADRNSYISIHDVLTAIQFVLTECPANKIFNVSGQQADASDSELAMLLYQNFPDQCKINLNWSEPKENTGILLNTQLIRRYGFTPQITLEDGLIILVKSLQDQNKVFIFDNTYLGKLTKVQQILLGYLLEIDRICKKHDIKYFLAGGTLLGAIRHHGFIPWDDDADVMMLREDYDRFLAVVQDEVPDNIFLQLPHTEKGNHNPFTKLRINNTMFATEFTGKFLDMHNGIFFDVLSHDRTGNHRWSQKLHLMATMLTRSIVFNKWGDTDVKGGGAHPLICKFVSKAKYFIPMPLAEWAQERSLRFFQKRKTDYLYDGMGRNLKRGAFPKAWLDEAVYVDFEGYQFPVPKEYNKYLTYLYGDYMQMIPVSQRRTSHSIVLTDLGQYSAYQCEWDQEKSR